MGLPSRVVGVVAVMALVASGCVSGEATEESLPSGTAPEPEVVMAHGALVQFDACESFLDYVISNAIDLVGPYGFDGGPIIWEGDFTRAGMAEEAARADAAAGDGGSGFSETNVQVEGVDEPDMVKTDGDRIVVVSEGELIVVDVTGDEPVETGRLSIRQYAVQSIFLEGDKVLLLGSAWSHGPLPLAEFDRAIAPGGTPTLQIIEVDLSDDPEVVRTMTIDGSFISGRMVDDTVRLVLTSAPVGFEWEFPSGSGLRAEREATEKNREIVRDSTEENWIPYYVVADGDGDIVDEGTLFDCERAAHPEEFSGPNMLSVITIDLGSGLDVIDATGVLANGDTVYASEDSLYVATQNWESWRWQATGAESEQPDGPATEIHKFDISSPTLTEYLASGEVEGYLLNQFAMDEHEGMLRVASTTTPAWWGSGPDSDSRITVLRQIDDSLVNVGLVDGLGKTEQIYSVRFIGDTAYVVTFRQTDPLYTVDLSDPRVPEVVGELKIPGYSAYLHPVGDGLIMGIGQDATDEGVVQGTQVSIFDVSDIYDPQRVDTYTLSEGTNSEVEYDHHAFLYWDGLAMIPVQQWWWDDKGEEVFIGAVGLSVGDDGQLAELGKVVHPGADQDQWDGRSQILRSVVVDGSVYTISPKGIMKSSLDSLHEQAWLDF
jgi:uncharacterized secreted protein with C-terminal beta-propeller domain